MLFDLAEYTNSSSSPSTSEENAAVVLDALQEFFENDEVSVAASQNMAALDRSSKSVDSGKVAIIYSTDSYGVFSQLWSGTSKERRRYIADQISDSSNQLAGVTLIFIEIIVTRESILRKIRCAKAGVGEANADSTCNEFSKQVKALLQ